MFTTGTGTSVTSLLGILRFCAIGATCDYILTAATLQGRSVRRPKIDEAYAVLSQDSFDLTEHADQPLHELLRRGLEAELLVHTAGTASIADIAQEPPRMGALPVSRFRCGASFVRRLVVTILIATNP